MVLEVEVQERKVRMIENCPAFAFVGIGRIRMRLDVALGMVDVAYFGFVVQG